MNKKIRLVVAVAVVASVVGLIYMTISEYRAKSSITALQPRDRGVSGMIENVHYSSTRGGRVDWELDAKTAVRRKNGDALTLDKVVMLIHSKGGDIYTLNAKDAIYSQSSGDVDASGGVTVKTMSGVTMNTDRVRYSTKTKKAATDGAVRVTSDKMTVTGKGLIMEPDKGSFSLLKEVKAIIRNN